MVRNASRNAPDFGGVAEAVTRAANVRDIEHDGRERRGLCREVRGAIGATFEACPCACAGAQFRHGTFADTQLPMKTALACLIILSACVSAFADDFTTTDGKKFEGVTVTRIEADGIMVMTDSGIAKIFFAKLPEDVQKKYGYDPAKAAQFQQQMQIDAAARRVRDAAAMQAEAAAKRAAQGEAKVAAPLQNPSAPEVPKGLQEPPLDKRAEMRGPIRGQIIGEIMEKIPGAYIIEVQFFRSVSLLRDERYMAVVEMPEERVKYIGDHIVETVVKTNRTRELFPDMPGKYAPAPVFVKALPPGK